MRSLRNSLAAYCTQTPLTASCALAKDWCGSYLVGQASRLSPASEYRRGKRDACPTTAAFIGGRALASRRFKPGKPGEQCEGAKRTNRMDKVLWGIVVPLCLVTVVV